MRDLWKQAARTFEEHLSRPFDQFKRWFKANGEMKLRQENIELRMEIVDLKRQLQEERSAESKQEPFFVMEVVERQDGIVAYKKELPTLKSAITLIEQEYGYLEDEGKDNTMDKEGCSGSRD